MLVDLKLHTRTKEELLRLSDQVKISELSYSEKTLLLGEIQTYLGDADTAKKRKILLDIAEGMADTADLVGG